MEFEQLKSLDETRLLTALIMGEAEGEFILGKIAVACVVRNRTKDARWPSSYHGVMLQPYQFSCFLPSFFRPEIVLEQPDNPNWRDAEMIARNVINDKLKDVTDGSNHYHSLRMKRFPAWADDDKVTVTLGNHVFYRL